MMKQEQDHIKMLMAKSLDGALSPDERSLLDRALQESSLWQKEYDAMQQMRHALARYEPSLDDNWSLAEIRQIVRNAGMQTQAKVINLAGLWSKVAVACGLAIAVSIGYQFLEYGSMTPDTIVGTEEITADEAYTYLSTNDWENE